MKKTPWFPPDVKPVHVGVYETRIYSDDCIRRYWNGRLWADSNFDVRIVQNRRWRGQAEKPKGK